MKKAGYNLVEAFNNGDQGAFKTIYNDHHRSVFFIAWKFLNNKDDAMDLAAEVLVKLWQKRGDFKSEEHIKGFLFTAIRNACLNHLRSAKRQSQREQEVARMQEIADEVAKNIEIEAEAYELILNAIDSLPPKCRNIFKLLIRGLTPEEIATRFNVSVKTVYTQRSIAIHRLRKQVLKYRFIILLSLMYVVLVVSREWSMVNGE
jgi:RNA polymerase sigma-70 factor (family 1)